jgi:hypothetical protein
MTLNAAQSVVATGTTPAPYTPTASDTIKDTDVDPGGGCVLRVVTTGTATNVTISDPGLTPLGNPVATPAVVACPATGVRYIYVSPAAVNRATGVATVLFSGALTGVTYDIIKF